MAFRIVKSNIIKAVDFFKGTLSVQLNNGRSFIYHKVPREVAIAFAQSPSKGRFYNAYIKGEYESERMD